MGMGLHLKAHRVNQNESCTHGGCETNFLSLFYHLNYFSATQYSEATEIRVRDGMKPGPLESKIQLENG